MATQKGLEPSTSAVTGRRSNQLSYCATSHLARTATDYWQSTLNYLQQMVGTVGIEPTTPRV